jgi:dTDP-4-dehydrorhamnose reductase
MKILLLGKDGQLGWELQRALAPLGSLTSLGRNEKNGLCGNLSNLDHLEKAIMLLKPDVIVNAGAYTAVDDADSNSDLAKQVNADAPKLLANLAKQLDALLVHYSTDYVFDGSGSAGWKEGDATGPLNVYGQTKLDGELAIRDAECKYLIFRTSWVYTAKGNNFAKSMMRLASDRDELNVISDQVGSPTSAELIADVSAHAIRLVVADSTLSGVYHLTASGETSWCDYARYVIRLARQNTQVFQVKMINEISSAEYKTPAQRPLNSRLDCSKLQQSFSILLPSWQVGVKRMLTEIQGSQYGT